MGDAAAAPAGVRASPHAGGRLTPWQRGPAKPSPAAPASGGEAHAECAPRVWTHRRDPQEVEQVSIGVQVAPLEEDRELCANIINAIESDLPCSDYRVLWKLFCDHDNIGGMSGRLGRFELTALLSDADPSAGARDIAQWIQALDQPTPGDTQQQGEPEVSFVDIIDWWDRATASTLVDEKLSGVREKLLKRSRQLALERYTTVDGLSSTFRHPRLAEMAPGEVAASTDGLLDSLLQVRCWLEAREVRRLEIVERELCNHSRRQPCCGLSADDHDRLGLLFRKYVSGLPSGCFAEEGEEEGGPADGTAEAAGTVSERGEEKLRLLQTFVDDGEMTAEEFEIKKAAVLRAEAKQAAPALTIRVGPDLRGLCAVVGITLTAREWDIIENSGVYQPRMDLHSFLCFAAVRLGKVQL
eukprot:TRINITY_DN19978_c0_g2_i1.p1 TRINITY_DN19978_c0_g2~~TRINITY_DN19978_c0_g2_i1.p1  ORF type:complete len:413 (+),score=139.71 TRINITY_DN19978_c0_g2_i1:86-1324(+)